MTLTVGTRLGSADGQRFLMIKENVAGEPTRAIMVVVVNEELKAKLAKK